MLTKWQLAKPTKFPDYLTLPSRWNLITLLRGNYNYCLSYDQVAEAVAHQYATAERHLRAEMVTSQIIAHRTGRMLSGFDGWDTRVAVNRSLNTNEPTGGLVTIYEWDGERGRAILKEGPRPIKEQV